MNRRNCSNTQAFFLSVISEVLVTA